MEVVCLIIIMATVNSIITIQLANFRSCMLENDLDGEALAVAVGQGPESLREAIPSLSKRLKLIGAVQLLKTFSSNPSSNSNQVIYVLD